MNPCQPLCVTPVYQTYLWGGRRLTDRYGRADAPAEGPVAESVSAAIDPDVAACDDFYTFACGGWLEATELPADKTAMYRSFTTIADDNENVLRALLERTDVAGNDALLSDFYQA